MEFKGTKGELELKYVSGICIGIGTIGDYSQITANTILPDTDEEYEKEREEIEANMKLYACAQEILEQLKKSNEILSDFYDNLDFKGRSEIRSFIDKSSELIQKATL